jgi:DNA-directed RNA polymerase subunit alpha
VAADRNFDEDLGIGWIPVDSTHSPVRKVNYLVESARVGQNTDYDKLTLEVSTSGAISPTEAIELAAQLLRDHLFIFGGDDDDDVVVGEGGDATPATLTEESNEHLDKSIEELELSVRSYNCLKNANIRTIRELVAKTENDLLKTKNFGRKSLKEIKEILNDMGLQLGMRIDNWQQMLDRWKQQQAAN